MNDDARDPRRWLGRLAAVFAGAVLVLSFPTPALWWWAYVGLVPVLLLVRAADDRREAVWRSWAAGTGFFAALHYWLLPHLSVFAVPIAIAIGVVWVPWGLAGRVLLRSPLRPVHVAGAFVVLPSIWIATEYVRSWDRLGGSWGFLGSTQWNVPPLLSVAALGGVWAVTLVLSLTNVAVAVALAPGASTAVRTSSLMVAVVAVGAALAYGEARPEPTVEGHLRIGAVQPGLIHDPEERLQANERITRELVRRDPGIDVVVWGQSSVGFDPEGFEEIRRRLVALAAEVDRQVVVNVDARRPGGRIAKSAVVVEPSGLGETYRKQRLVPFGEYIPFRSVFGWVEELTQAASEDRVPGTGLTTFSLAGVRVGPLISYESTFPDMRRTLATYGVSMTLVQAAATTFQGTWALPQQGSFEAVRAVESGRPAVLVSVSGTSSAFDGRGRRLAWVPQTDTGGWTVDVPLSTERTSFVRWGPWIPLGSMIVTAIAGLVAIARSVRRRQSLAQSSNSRSLVSGRSTKRAATAPAGANSTRAAPPNSA